MVDTESRAPGVGYLSRLAGLGVLILGGTLLGCNSGTYEVSNDSPAALPASLGEPVKGDVPTVCAGCLGEEKLGETLAIEGEVVDQCPANGCWFRMKDDVGEVFVDLAPAKLRLTEKHEGQHAKATGRVMKHGGQFRLEAQHVQFTPAKTDATSQEK